MTRTELWTIPLKTTSLAFIGGAAPNEEAELRVSSIRGALRSWYRLLVGPEVAAGLVAPGAGLSESALFGGTAAGEGQGAVLLSLSDVSPTGRTPWKSSEVRARAPGRAYLGFSLDMRPNERKALAPQTEFTLRVILPRGLSETRARLLFGALWMWITLGGLGSRSRRGFGGLTWAGVPSFSSLTGDSVDPRPDAMFPQVDRADSFVKVHSALQRAFEGLRAARRDALDGLATASEPDKQPIYRLESARVLLWGGYSRNGWSTADEAHNMFGQAYGDFRRQPRIDGLSRSALRMLTDGERLDRPPARTAFGLPLAVRPVGPRGGGPGFELLPYSPAERRKDGRAPSPLLARLCPIADKQWGLLLTLLGGVWPGRDLAVQERRQQSGYMSPDGRIDLPSRFLDDLKSPWEVRW